MGGSLGRARRASPRGCLRYIPARPPSESPRRARALCPARAPPPPPSPCARVAPIRPPSSLPLRGGLVPPTPRAPSSALTRAPRCHPFTSPHLLPAAGSRPLPRTRPPPPSHSMGKQVSSPAGVKTASGVKPDSQLEHEPATSPPAAALGAQTAHQQPLDDERRHWRRPNSVAPPAGRACPATGGAQTVRSDAAPTTVMPQLSGHPAPPPLQHPPAPQGPQKETDQRQTWARPQKMQPAGQHDRQSHCRQPSGAPAPRRQSHAPALSPAPVEGILLRVSAATALHAGQRSATCAPQTRSPIP